MKSEASNMWYWIGLEYQTRYYIYIVPRGPVTQKREWVKHIVTKHTSLQEHPEVYITCSKCIQNIYEDVLNGFLLS